MARPRKDTPPDLFTTADLAVGTGLSSTNVIFLSGKGLISGFGSVDQGSFRLGNIHALKRAAVIGGLVKAGVEPVLAAKLVAHIADHLEGAYDEIPSRLDIYLGKELNPQFPHRPWEGQEGDPDSRNDFWLHHLLMTRTEGLYRRGEAFGGDFLIEIADRRYVFMDVIRSAAAIPIKGGIHYSAEPMFRVVEWERGEDAEILPFHIEAADETETGKYFSDSERDRRGYLAREYQMAYAHAVGRIRVNISLAIRNALDAIHEHRKARQ